MLHTVAIDLETLERMIGEQVPLAVAASEGPAHVLRWVTRGFSRLAKTPSEALIGRPFEEALPSSRSDGAVELLDRVFSTGQEASLPGSYSVAPLINTRGNPEGLLIRVDDAAQVTASREQSAADDLREANQRLLLASLRAEEQFEEAAGEAAHFNALFESLHEGVTIVDNTGRVLLMNPAARALFGDAPQASRDPSELMQTRDLRRLDDGQLAADQWPSTRALRGEAFNEEELVLVREDGARLRLLCSGSAIRDNGEVILAVVVERDVTALRLLEQTKDDYLALISHDLRAPLTSVHTEAQLLQRQLQRGGHVDGAGVKRIYSIVTNARRMNAMIQELLESSRLESGNMILNKTRIQIVPLLRDIVDRVGSDRVQVQAEAENGEAAISVDAERIERVLTNLITNALKYSPPGTPVFVRTEQGQDATLVSVVDQGDGIPPDELSRLFQRFTRGRAGPTKDASGVGLGLYIARLIVEAHGGRMSAESSVGNGSTFSFSLPKEALSAQP